MAPTEPSDDDNEWEQTWADHASAFDRVTSVTMTLSEPRSAPWIAEAASVSANTARDHLRRLIELGVVAATEADGTRLYAPDPLYLRLRDVREVLSETTEAELAERAADRKAEIADWKSEYGVDSPDRLREQAATDEVGPDEAYELVRTASDWELVQYRLSILQDALENYDTWTSDPSSITA